MPNPEPTLAEICKTVREMYPFQKTMYAVVPIEISGSTLEAFDSAAENALPSVCFGGGGSVGMYNCRSLPRSDLLDENPADTITQLRLALVQAAEQGEEYRNKMDEIHARETARIGPHGGIDSTDCARAGGMLNAVEEIRQALSSGAPT